MEGEMAEDEMGGMPSGGGDMDIDVDMDMGEMGGEEPMEEPEPVEQPKVLAGTLYLNS